MGWGPGRSQPCQVSSKSLQGFWLPEWSKSAIFLCLALWLIQQVRATAQPVINTRRRILLEAKTLERLQNFIAESNADVGIFVPEAQK